MNKNINMKIIHSKWSSMKSRCGNKNKPNYVNVKICDEWKKFKNFKDWVLSDKSNYHEGYVLDKDILQWESDIKIYSPDTCILYQMD